MTTANPGPEPDGPDERGSDNTPDSARHVDDHRWPPGPGDPGPDSATPTDEKVKGPGVPASESAATSVDRTKGPGPANVPGE